MLSRITGHFSPAPLLWVNRDAWLIISARGIRTFSQSFVAVLLALYLLELEFSLFQVGALLSVGVAGVAFLAFAVVLVVGQVGRRRLLVTFSVVSASAALTLFFVEDFPPLVLVVFVGNFLSGTDGCADAGLLYHGGGGARGKGRHGQSLLGEPERCGGHRPIGDHCPLERLLGGRALSLLGRDEDRLRPYPIRHVPKRQTTRGGTAAPQTGRGEGESLVNRWLYRNLM